MSSKAVFDARRHELFAEIREAEARYREARLATRKCKERLIVTRARYAEFADIERKVNRLEIDLGCGQVIDAATSTRVSEMIANCLERAGSLTLAQLSEILSDVKKNTISAALYNMKQRGQLEHSEATGKYALSLEVRRNQMTHKAR